LQSLVEIYRTVLPGQETASAALGKFVFTRELTHDRSGLPNMKEHLLLSDWSNHRKRVAADGLVLIFPSESRELCPFKTAPGASSGYQYWGVPRIPVTCARPPDFGFDRDGLSGDSPRAKNPKVLKPRLDKIVDTPLVHACYTPRTPSKRPLCPNSF